MAIRFVPLDSCKVLYCRR